MQQEVSYSYPVYYLSLCRYFPLICDYPDFSSCSPHPKIDCETPSKEASLSEKEQDPDSFDVSTDKGQEETIMSDSNEPVTRESNTEAISKEINLNTMSMDDKIGFIIETTKIQHRNIPAHKRKGITLKRKRKDKSQTDFLIEKTQGALRLTREDKIALAKATGLTKIQVYKWWWDHRCKHRTVE